MRLASMDLPARGADKQQVMATGCRNLEGALGSFHPFDLREVGSTRTVRKACRLRRGKDLRATEVIHRAKQVWQCQHLDASGPRRLATLRRGTDEP